MSRKPTYDELLQRVQELEQAESQRDRAKTALLDSEARLSTFLNNSPVAMGIWDHEFRYVYVNKALQKMNGPSIENHLGRTIEEVLPKSAHIIRPLFEQIFSSGQALQNLELKGEVPSNPGQISHFIASYFPILDSKNKVQFIGGSITDITKLKLAEEALSESEKRFKAIYEYAPVLIDAFDQDGRCILWNNECQKTFGWTIEEINSHGDALSLFYPDPDVREKVIRTVTTDPDARFREWNPVTKDGKILHTMWANFKLPDGLTFNLGYDITEQKSIEEKLKSSSKRFSSLFEETPVPIWEEDFTDVFKYFAVLREKGVVNFRKHFDENPEEILVCSQKVKVLNVNRSALILHDAQNKEELLGNLDKIFTKKSLVVFKEELIALANGQIEFETEGEVKTISGAKRNVLLKLIIDKKSDDEIIALITTMDITARKTYENQLRVLNNAIDNSLNGFDIVDENSKFVFVNKAYIKMWGYDNADEILGTSPESHCLDPSIPHKIIHTLKKFGECEIEFKAKRKDGTLFDVLMYARLAHNQDGQEIYPTTSIDVTERKQLQNRLQQAQKMESIGNLAGGIAHDFNNILTPIIGMAELLMDDLGPGSLEYDNAKEIFMAGKRGGDLVRQILSFSRQHEHRLVPVRVQNILKEVLTLIRSTIPSDIQIQHDINPDCGTVKADANQIHQVAMNLITNAYHAVMETSGKIEVKLRQVEIQRQDLKNSLLRSGTYIVMSVSDNGVGIPKGNHNKIFEPYFTTKIKGKGTGLGLAVVYGIVKEHQGDIKVYSEPGQGTTFSVYLPLMETDAEYLPDKNKFKIETGTERILLVDDEISVLKLQKTVLERLGYKVTACEGSSDALTVFTTDPFSFDLVISDMTMPYMTGDRLAKELLSIRSEIPIIICTGFSERINKEKAEAIGVEGFLMKPVIKSELAKKVREVLDGNKTISED